jgi:uncharacterized membrane protein YcaP (DUF421 family)
MTIDNDVVRALILLAAGYAGVAFLVKISKGKTLAKMNAFELFVTVAIGGLLVGGFVRPELPLEYALGGGAFLVAVQALLTFLARRLRRHDFFAGEPALLFRRGHFLRGNMRRYRVTEEEVVRALRAGGWKNYHEVEALLLEPDGTFAIFGREHREGPVSSRGA